MSHYLLGLDCGTGAPACSDQVDGLLHGLGIAGGLDDDGEALAVGALQHVGEQRIVGDKGLGTEGAGGFEAAGHDIGGHHAGTAGASDLDAGEADGAAAEDEDILGADLAAGAGLDADAHGLGEGGPGEAEARGHQVDEAGRRLDVFSIAAGDVDTDDGEVGAAVRLADAAEVAGPQRMKGSTTTGVPRAGPSTPGPSSATMPEISWPQMAG